MLEHPIGPYQLTARLGTGGMGDVYLARDSRLGRQVALKLLPKYFINDQERVRRFQQEALAASALSHPNVATIYETGEAEGRIYIAMEFVEGTTLDAKITGRSLETSEILDVGLQVASALVKAHAKGIIHRDIKPGNILVTAEGHVKVVDFGLAKVNRTEQPPVMGDRCFPATTEPGVLMGTVTYMSPEQALGRTVDQRTDLFSLGVVLYEMATGRPPFSGATRTETIDQILHTQPEAIARFNYTIPAALEQIVRKCLEKEPDQRYQSARELQIDPRNLKRDLESGAPDSAPMTLGMASGRGRKRERIVWITVAAALLLLTLALALAYFQRAPVEVRAVRSFILPPEDSGMVPPFFPAQVTVSPDGLHLAFVATTAAGKQLLWVRSLDTLSAQALAGTEAAELPFWSPDSRALGFFADQKLKKIELSSGPPITLCDAPAYYGGYGGTWGRNGVIVFAKLGGGLARVSAAGGDVGTATLVDPAHGETTHRWPYFLPDGRHFLYLGMRSGAGDSGLGTIYATSLESKESKRLLEVSSNVAYAQGYLLFLREGTLMAQRFDVERLETVGDALPVAEQVNYASGEGRGVFSVSQNGFLAYQVSGLKPESQLTWFNRQGEKLGVLGDPGQYDNHRLSPDGKRLSVCSLDPLTRTRDIWIYEVASGLRTRFTLDAATERISTWSLDGSYIIFNSNRNGYFDLYQKASGGVGGDEPILESNVDKFPISCSPDGRFLIYHIGHPTTGRDLWVLPLSDDRESTTSRKEPFPFVQTEFVERFGQFSPDGRWIAYDSNESGRFEVYVAPFPGPGGKRRISLSGGEVPRWRGDGKEIFYEAQVAGQDTLMAAELNGAGGTMEVCVGRPLFNFRWGGSGPYDVTPDGQRFLVNMRVGLKTPPPITLVQNWTADLKR
ncbi:MAG: serine/threonine-protein kinase [Acidobacteria bacterium]|nr:serine/threonine-protein kinase [Acidobacteriota bacterium]